MAYALYGAVYLGGAMASLGPEHKVDWFGLVPWWIFFLAGTTLMVCIPVMIWRRWWWLTRFMALGPAVKALVLTWRQGQSLSMGMEASSYNWAFAVVAASTAILMGRASWRPTPGPNAIC